MGSFVYGYVMAQRVANASGESQATAAPAMTTYIYTLAALVPAEALALYAGVVVPNVTSAVPVAGNTGTVISDPALLGWSCAGLLVLSARLYIVGRMKEKRTLSLWDIPRALIPLAAFTGWSWSKNPGVFDVWWHGSNMAGRVVIAAFAAIVIGGLAKALATRPIRQGQPRRGSLRRGSLRREHSQQDDRRCGPPRCYPFIASRENAGNAYGPASLNLGLAPPAPHVARRRPRGVRSSGIDEGVPETQNWTIGARR